MRRAVGALAWVGLVALAAPPGPVAARPAYFEIFTAKFGFTEGDRLYACGVCHYRWEGTGARNPFGSTVEQQIFSGKPISDAIDVAVLADADADGFTSFDELSVHETLPGYSCANFFEAIDPPPDWHTFIEPGVPSCLEPKDIRADPTQLTLQTDRGKTVSQLVTIFNNGKDESIELLAVELAPGHTPALSVELRRPPSAALVVPPFTLDVGETAEATLVFAPTGALLNETTLQIESDDPDEATLEVGVTAIGRVQPLAPPDARAACLKDVDHELRGFTKTHTKEWGRCQGDEVEGLVCDGGARDRKLLVASEALHEKIGGPKDKRCEGANLTPRLVGQPQICGGGCGEIALLDFEALADCLTCRQEEATTAMLVAALGATPPDTPDPVERDAARCADQLLKGLQKGIAKAQQILGRCALDNVTAETPVDCAAALDADLAKIRSDVDAKLAKCNDSAGLAGCYAEPKGSPTCLGEAAVAIGSGLVDATFGLED